MPRSPLARAASAAAAALAATALADEILGVRGLVAAGSTSVDAAAPRGRLPPVGVGAASTRPAPPA